MSNFSIETPDLVAPDGNGYYGSDAHVCDLQLAVEMNGKRVLELEARLQIDTLNPNRREHIIQQAAKIAKLEKNLLLAEDLLSDDSYQHYLDSTGKSSALKDQG